MPFSTQLARATGICFAVWFGLSLQVAVAATADDYFERARGHLAEGEVRAAVIELKNALQSDPTHVEARVMLGTLHLRSNDSAAAAKEFARARDLGADKGAWMPGYAQALLLQGRYQDLLDEVEVGEGIGVEQRAVLLALRGNANLALRRMDAAAADYDAALALAPDQPIAGLGRARILLAGGEDEEALQQLDSLLQSHPEHVESLLVRGDLMRRLRRLDDAAADYAQAARVAPANPRAHLGLALVHVAQRDIAAAKQDLAALNRLTRDLPAVNYLQALVSFQEGDLTRASDELQVLLRVAPSNLQAQLLYGIVSYSREEYTIADDYLTRVFASVPGNTQVVKLLGAARLKLRQPDRAVEVLATAVDDQTEDAQLLALLGTAYLQTGENSRGAELIERAVEVDPDQAMLRTQLAVGKIAEGDTAGAISQLESAVALGQDVIQADVLLVLSYLNRKEFDKALEASHALEQRMSESPIPLNLTGLALLAQRKFDEATARFRQALEKDPGFQVARMNLARLALVAGKPDEAAAAYQEALAKDPKHLGALMGMAALARVREDEEAAERWLRRANQANPHALRPILLLAEGYLRRNEGLKAANVLSGLSPEQRELPAALRLKGMAQLQSGDYANAIFTLQKLTAQQPSSIEGWFQLARAQAASGNAAAARSSFERAIDLDTAHQVPVVWIGLGELELREGRYAAALAAAEQLRTHFPDNAYGHEIAAAAHRGLGQQPEAVAASRAALELEPSSSRVVRYAGQLTAAGQRDEAIAALRDWVDRHADDRAAWSSLGMLQQQAGRETDALAAYEQAIQGAQPNPVILNNMAWLYLERDATRALELATRAYELAPSRAEIVDTYGWVLYRLGRKSDGLAALQQALIIAPRNAEIALHVAEALHGLKRDAEARPMLERILREHPNSGFAQTARELLGKLRG